MEKDKKGSEHTHHVTVPHEIPKEGLHPEQLDPLGTLRHAPVAHNEKKPVFILTVGLTAAILLIPILSVTSASPIANVFVGLLPLLVTLVLDMIAIKQHYKPVVLWINLAIVHLLAIGVLSVLNAFLAVQLSVTSAIMICIFFSVIITVFAFLATGSQQTKHHHVVEFKPQKIKEYIHSIEDKVKAINFVIGRVYRSSNGGSPKLRERLRVPSDWYNEFNTVQENNHDEELKKAKVLIRKIRDRISLYAMKEKDVFSEQEMATLKHIVRNKEGHDTILSVLKANDSDPVENYYDSAVEFCDRILQELEGKE